MGEAEGYEVLFGRRKTSCAVSDWFGVRAVKIEGSGRSTKYVINDTDVDGPMADDTIYNYVQNYMDGKISRAAFWELAKFKYPTH